MAFDMSQIVREHLDEATLAGLSQLAKLSRLSVEKTSGEWTPRLIDHR